MCCHRSDCRLHWELCYRYCWPPMSYWTTMLPLNYCTTYTDTARLASSSIPNAVSVQVPISFPTNSSNGPRSTAANPIHQCTAHGNSICTKEKDKEATKQKQKIKMETTNKYIFYNVVIIYHIYISLNVKKKINSISNTNLFDAHRRHNAIKLNA